MQGNTRACACCVCEAMVRPEKFEHLRDMQVASGHWEVVGSVPVSSTSRRRSGVDSVSHNFRDSNVHRIYYLMRFIFARSALGMGSGGGLALHRKIIRIFNDRRFRKTCAFPGGGQALPRAPSRGVILSDLAQAHYPSLVTIACCAACAAAQSLCASVTSSSTAFMASTSWLCRALAYNRRLSGAPHASCLAESMQDVLSFSLAPAACQRKGLVYIKFISDA